MAKRNGFTLIELLVVITIIAVFVHATFAGGTPIVDVSKSPHVLLRNLPMNAVTWTTGFWADRFELCHKAMLPTLHSTLLDPKCSAQLNRIKFTAGLLEHNPKGVNWADGDCYKWIETMAHVYAAKEDRELDRLMDEWITIIAKAQDEDGYISTNIGHDKDKRLQMPYLHELYNMGHLFTAACIHHRATGKRSFLDIAQKLAEYLYREFKTNPPQLVHFPWNPSVHMGLVEMYRTTGDCRQLELAEIMINNRGSQPGGNHKNGGTDQTQDRMPLRRESEAVGHAVTAMYLYCGAADLYAETGDGEIYAALERIWDSVTLRKMDITGSVAMGNGKSIRGDPVHEAFGYDYALPNLYNETCANIGNGMFNWRMLSLSGHAEHADVMEKVAYNCLNASVDLKGENWFYCNPLSWNGTVEEYHHKHHHTGLRWRTNNCYCCPPSVARTTAKLHNWVYSTTEDGLWVHLYGGNKLSTTLADGSTIKLTQETNYPWDGKIKLTVNKAGKRAFAIRMRIPNWAEHARLKLNGGSFSGATAPGTYATIQRVWKAGDTIALNFPMPIRLMEANPKAKELHNKVAVMRGPLVYCLEVLNQEGGAEIWRDGVFLPENIELTPEHRREFLGGVTVLKGKALTEKGRKRFITDIPNTLEPEAADWHDLLYRPFQPRSLKHMEENTIKVALIPYYAWANRGHSRMTVWIPLAR
ncbi:MAG TPA: beta-L-arabinofuranosidase domain-containing protein [Sedimentisphaerales bacterium]|nr:beta-L-arabinofuranosidase domain-containing protein [Sedimentisphaerales bacterium]